MAFLSGITEGDKLKKNRYLYSGINFCVIVLTAVFFLYGFSDSLSIFCKGSLPGILIVICTVILVHALKLSRLYFALYDTGIGFRAYLKTYCKVTPVSIVFPFKIGELFRIYCYSVQIGNALKGTVIILLDRFIDTIALLTMLLFAFAFENGQSMPIVYILLGFTLIGILIYLLFPGIYHFWKRYLLRADASEHKLWALKGLEDANTVYMEIAGVAKGRGAVLYFLSLLAWGVEIGSIVLVSRFEAGSGARGQISQYLSAALGIDSSPELSRFIVISVIGLILLYLGIKFREVFQGRRQNR